MFLQNVSVEQGALALCARTQCGKCSSRAEWQAFRYQKRRHKGKRRQASQRARAESGFVYLCVTLLEKIKEAVHEVDDVEGLPAVSPVNEWVLHAVCEKGISVNDVADRHAEITEDVCPLWPESLLQVPVRMGVVGVRDISHRSDERATADGSGRMGGVVATVWNG